MDMGYVETTITHCTKCGAGLITKRCSARPKRYLGYGGHAVWDGVRICPNKKQALDGHTKQKDLVYDEGVSLIE